MCDGSYIPLILGRPFLATACAVVDLPNKRVIFSNIDRNIFHNTVADNDGVQRGSCVTIDYVKKLDLIPTTALSGKNEVNGILDGDTHFYVRKSMKVIRETNQRTRKWWKILIYL